MKRGATSTKRACSLAVGRLSHVRNGKRGWTGARLWAFCALAAGLPLLLLLGAFGCGKEDVARPQDTPTNVITAHYQSREAFASGIIALNGERIDLEWGSQFTPERPYTQVRLSADEGNGAPGATQYVSMKAVYTDTHLYLLIQWSDATADISKDVFAFVGPDFGDPIVTCTGGECDTTERTGPQDSLLSPAWWYQFGDDDKLALAFEIEPVVDARGAFPKYGCQVACHADQAIRFGSFDDGRLDMWEWMAGRTNPIRNLFNRADDPEDPPQGTPGYMEDLYANPTSGLVPDPGNPGYFKNFDEGTGTPRHPYRRVNDPLDDPINPDACHNRFGEACVSNNGVRTLYLWRETATRLYPAFSPNDTLFEGNLPADPRPWAYGDIVPGYVISYPTESRADVRASGGHEEDGGVWTLEVGRLLDTGDPDHDVIFEPESGTLYYFTIALFDADVGNHWGSEPQILRFGEKQTQ